MTLVNLNTLPGLGRTPGMAAGFADFPRFPEFPDVSTDFEPAATSPQATGNAGAHFAEILENAIQAVNQQDLAQHNLAAAAATGADIDPHTLMIETAKAETMVHLTSSVTTKMAQNVQTIMNMQI